MVYHIGDRLHFDTSHLTAISVKDQKIRRQKPEFQQKIFTIVPQKCLPKALARNYNNDLHAYKFSYFALPVMYLNF